MTNLKGGHVVVTGGTGALGVAVVKALVEAGAHCHVPAIESVVPAEHFPRSGVSVTTNVDLSNEDAVSAFYDKLPPLAGNSP
jgi:NAD(P)-dependent dehydrogenase (short-subunit alcohol dehydrogenase family)